MKTFLLKTREKSKYFDSFSFDVCNNCNTPQPKQNETNKDRFAAKDVLMMLNDFPKTFLPFDKIEIDRHLRKGKQMIGALIQSSYIIGNKRRRKWNEV